MLHQRLAFARQVNLLPALIAHRVQQVLVPPGRGAPRGRAERQRASSRALGGFHGGGGDPDVQRGLAASAGVRGAAAFVRIGEPPPNRRRAVGLPRGRVRRGRARAVTGARAVRAVRGVLADAEVLALGGAAERARDALALDSEFAHPADGVGVQRLGDLGDEPAALPRRAHGFPRLQVLALDRDRGETELSRHAGLSPRGRVRRPRVRAGWARRLRSRAGRMRSESLARRAREALQRRPPHGARRAKQPPRLLPHRDRANAARARACTDAVTRATHNCATRRRTRPRTFRRRFSASGGRETE